jgi:hypothetical protein
MAFERVYTVWEYWDGPRSGIASYSGLPHHYRCEWDEPADDYADTYVLTPIDQETFSLAMEQWLIWRQWEVAFHSSEASGTAHPAQQGANSQYAELQRRIEARLSLQSPQHGHKHATFRVRPQQENLPSGVMRELEVEWLEANI